MYITMELDKAFVHIGEELCYKITIQNDECYMLSKAHLVGGLPNCLTLIGGTFGNQMNIIPEMLEEGIPIGTILKGQKQTVFLYTELRTFPINNPIVYTMDLFFYSDDLNQQEVVPTNTVMSLVSDPDIRMESGTICYACDKEVIDRDDYITYTLSLSNKGNTEAKDIFIFDLIPDKMSLVKNSMLFQGEIVSLDNSSLIKINQIKQNETKTITYTVQPSECLVQNEIVHSASVEYSFLLANRKEIRRKELSNTSIVKIETAYFDKEQGGFIKEVSEQLCSLEDYLTYSLTITNLGNAVATHVTIVDTIPKHMKFIDDSISLNDKSLKGVTLKDPICLTDLKNGETVVISYQVQLPTCFVEGLGECLPAELIYSYKSNGKLQTHTIYSDAPSVQVYSPILNNYEEDRLFEIQETSVGIGDFICGNLHITNRGNISIDKMYLAIEVTEGINNFSNLWTRYENVLLCQVDESLEAGSHYQIPLLIKVESLLALPSLKLKAVIKYIYCLGDKVIEKDLWFKDEVVVTIQTAWFECVKTVNQPIAQIGELLKYTLQLTNVGNTIAKEVKVKEIENASLEVKPNSLKINGVSVIENILEGITISEILSKETYIIEYIAQIKQEVVPQIVSMKSLIHYAYEISEEDKREVELDIVSAETIVEEAYIVPNTKSIIMLVDKDYASVGDSLKYSLKLVNLGNRTANHVSVEFPELSCGKWKNDRKITLGSIDPGKSVVIEATLEVITVPYASDIELVPKLCYSFDSNNEVINRIYTLGPLKTRICYACLSEKDGGIIHSVKPACVTIGETVTCLSTLKNTGNTIAYGIKLRVILPQGVSFIDDTQKKESVLELAQIEPGEIVTLSYSVKVEELGVNGVFKAQEELMYTYKVKDQVEVVTRHMQSPNIYVNDPNIQEEQLEWSMDKPQVYINDEVKYTLKIENVGNTIATNINCQVYMDEGLKPCNTQYIIEHLLPEEVKTIVFCGKVVSLPQSERISAKVRLGYTFYKGANSLIERTIETRWLSAPVYMAGPYDEKSWGVVSSKEVVGYGEPICLKILCKNEGNQTMKNTTIMLLWQDGSPLSLDNIEDENKVLIGDILKQESYELEVKGNVSNIPKDSLVNVKVIMQYQFISDKKNTMKEETLEQELRLITIKDCGLSNLDNIVLEVDKDYAALEESLTYHLQIINKGNAVAKNIKVCSLPSSELSYIANSLQVVVGECIEDGISQFFIPYLKVGEGVEITWECKVCTIPINQYATMNAYVVYDYVDGYGKTKICEKQIPSIKTKIESTDFSHENLVKRVNFKEVTIGEEVVYDIICRNEGNVRAEEVYLIHQFPRCLRLMSETISINQSKKEQYTSLEALYLGYIGPREEVSISFKAYVEWVLGEDIGRDYTVFSYTFPLGENKQREELILKEQQFVIKAPRIKVEIELNSSRVIKGERISYHIILSNEGNVSAEHITVENMLPETMSFIQDSLFIQGMNRKDLSTLEDIVLAQIQSSEKIMIDFEAIVKEDFKKSQIQYVPKIRYAFNLRGEMHKTFTEGESIMLEVERDELMIYQTTDKENMHLEIGDEINYTVKLINSGTLKAMKMNFFNQLPEGVKFIHGSFKVNNKNIGTANLEGGITIGELEIQQTIILSYKVRVETYCLSELKNLTYVTYVVQLDEIKPIQKKQTSNAITKLRLLCPNKSKFNCKSHITLPYTLPDCERIINLETKISIIDIQYASQDKKEILIKGLINYTLTYVSILGEKEILPFKKVILHQMKLLKTPKTLVDCVQVINYKVSHTIINPRELQVGMQGVLNEI